MVNSILAVFKNKKNIYVFLILLLTLFAYLNSFYGEFHFDDIATIVNNNSIRTINPVDVFKSNNPLRFTGFYSFAVNYRLCGLDHLPGWHAVNLLIHFLCAYVLFRIIIMLDRSQTAVHTAGVAAMLFTAHPLCSEAVNYVQARHVMLCTLFSLVSFLCFLGLNNVTKRKPLSLLLLLVFLVAAALSKEVGVYYGFVPIVLYFGLFKTSIINKSARYVLLCAGGILISGAIWKYLIPSFKMGVQSFPYVGDLSYGDLLLTGAFVYIRFLFMVFPMASQFTVNHDVLVLPSSEWYSYAPIVFIVSLISSAIVVRKKQPIISLLIIWSILGYLPYIIVRGSAELMVEYKMYYSMLPISALISYAFVTVYRRLKNTVLARRLIIGILIAFLVLSLHVTHGRNRVWADEIALWQDALTKDPDNSRIFNNLALAYVARNNKDAAKNILREAIKKDPSFVEAYTNLGDMYMEEGQDAVAAKLFSKAITLDPTFMQAYTNLGVLLYRAGNVDDAVRVLNLAINENPNHPDAYYNLGIICSKLEKYDVALSYFNMCIACNPSLPDVYNNVGVVNQKTGNIEGAIEAFNKALTLNPDYAEARYNLGVVYGNKGEFEKAIMNYVSAIKLNPDNAYAYNNLAVMYYKVGNISAAEDSLKHALRLEPLNDEFKKNAAIIRAH